MLTDSLLMLEESKIEKYILQRHTNMGSQVTVIWTPTWRQYGPPLHKNMGFHFEQIWAPTSQ